MTVNLDLALGAGMRAFARPITVYPLASRPGAAPYPARGVYSARDVEVATEQGYILSHVLKLGIRLADFVDTVEGSATFGAVVPPVQRDEVELLNDRAMVLRYTLRDPPRFDGQGGADLVLASLTPPARRPS